MEFFRWSIKRENGIACRKKDWVKARRYEWIWVWFLEQSEDESDFRGR